MLDGDALSFQPFNMDHLTNQPAGRHILLWAIVLAWGGILNSPAVQISPSRNPAGTTNSMPNSNNGAPSIFRNPLKWIFGSGRSEAMNRVQAPPNFKVELLMEPSNFVPSSNSVLKARMVAINQGRDKYILEFETAQHFDFLIESKSGKEFYRSSGDKTYTNLISTIVLNRNEKLVYEDEIFSSSNGTSTLPAGEYKLTGKITAKTPITVETAFQVSPAN